MKISFSTASFANLDFQTAADLAKKCNYDAVELVAARDGASTSNALLTGPAKIRRIFSDADIEIAALHIGNDLAEFSARVELAAELGCHFIKLKSDSLFGRTDAVSPGMIDQLISAGDTAAAADVMVLIENQPTTGSAVRLWHLLDRLNHPAIACCWDTLLAAVANDLPTVAVPTLNSRIRSVNLQDAKGNPLACCELGEGELPLRKSIDRLRGIGFDGYLNLGFVDESGIEPEQQLHAARRILEQWGVVKAAAAG